MIYSSGCPPRPCSAWLTKALLIATTARSSCADSKPGDAMPEQLHVFDVAKELGVNISLVIKIADHLNIPLRRGAARVTQGQAARIREECHRGNWKLPPSAARKPEVRLHPDGYFRAGRCACCKLSFRFTEDQDKPKWCRNCGGHYEIRGESPERQLARLIDHEARLSDWCEQASSKANEFESRMKHAYEGRQRWKTAFVEVILAHAESANGKCAACAERCPCTTWRTLEYANKGIAREVERLATLPPSQLDDELNRSEPWRSSKLRGANPFAD
jgi:hypothetical protein